jgi:hypothetical protein
MQPAELVAIMASIIYSGRRDAETERAETRQSAVEEAWQLWHLTMDEWSDPGVRRFDDPSIAP